SNPQPPVLETGGLCLALGAAASPRFPPAPRSGSLHSLAPSRSLRSARALAATAVRQHWPPRAKPPRDGVENLAGQEGIGPPTPGFGDRWALLGARRRGFAAVPSGASLRLASLARAIALAPFRSRSGCDRCPSTLAAPRETAEGRRRKSGRTGGNRTPNPRF